MEGRATGGCGRACVGLVVAGMPPAVARDPSGPWSCCRAVERRAGGG